MDFQEAQRRANVIFGEDGVAMIGKKYEVGRWGEPGDFICLGEGESWEEAFRQIGVMEPRINP